MDECDKSGSFSDDQYSNSDRDRSDCPWSLSAGNYRCVNIKPEFSERLICEPWEIIFFGASVEGVVIVLIIGVLITSIVVCAQIIADIEIKKIETGKDEQSIRLSQLPHEVSKETVDESIAEIKRKIDEANRPVENFDVVKAVLKLNYSHGESEKIREFPAKRLGPWSISGETKSYMLSVPGNISEGEAYWCQKNVNRYYEIRSRLDDHVSGIAKTIKITHPITVAETCPETQDFLQVPCSAALVVFGGDVVTCEGNGKPRWKIKSNKTLKIWITEVSPPEDTTSAYAPSIELHSDVSVAVSRQSRAAGKLRH